MHHKGLGKRERLTNITTEALAQGVIPSLDMVGLALFFATRHMLTIGNYRLVCRPEVGKAKVGSILKWSSVTYTIFTGFIGNWPMVYPGGQDAKVTIRCVDAFKYFANTKISIDLATNYTDQLVDQVLNATGWTAKETNITGSVGMTERDCYIEAIEHQIGRGTWQTTWQLSPASTLNYWVLGDTNLSVLGTSTVPGF